MKMNRNSYMIVLGLLMLMTMLSIMNINPGWAQEKSVVLGAANWEPVYAKSLQNGGVFTELTVEAFRRSGYRCEVHFVPWKRALEVAKKGGYDGVMGGEHRKERLPYFLETDAIMTNKESLYCHSEKNITYATMSDLKPYLIGILRGSSLVSFQEVGIKTEEVGTYEQNLKKLMTHRIDLMVVGQLTMRDLLKKFPEYQEKIKLLNPPMFEDDILNLISKKRQDANVIVAAFNRGLQEIKADGTFNTIIEKHGFTNELFPNDLK